MKIKLIISTIVLLSNGLIAQVPNELLKALHQVESSGRYGAIIGDGGRALGPFQIHKGYWQDATDYDKSIKGKYSDCADYDYSVKVINAYIKRYAKSAVATRNFEKIARIHNGGPLGYTNKNTLKYWKKVEVAMGK